MPRKRLPRKPIAPRTPQAAEPLATNPALQSAVLEIIDTQLREREPPETWQTLERLVAAGYTAEGARQLIAHVVVSEIFTVMTQGEPYNAKRFVAALQRLPTLPGDY